MANISEFYKRLREICEENNLTINELAQTLKLSSGSPTAWKNGAVPRAATLEKIAAYFGVSVDYLLDNESKNTPAEAGKRVDGGLNLSDREIYLIHLFRKLDDRNQSATFSFINSLYETQPGEKAHPAPKEA